MSPQMPTVTRSRQGSFFLALNNVPPGPGVGRPLHRPYPILTSTCCDQLIRQSNVARCSNASSSAKSSTMSRSTELSVIISALLGTSEARQRKLHDLTTAEDVASPALCSPDRLPESHSSAGLSAAS